MNALCQCGCGQATRVAPVNDRSKGWIKGEPLRFLKGHNAAINTAKRATEAIGNRRLTSHGYVLVLIAKGVRQYEHILVAERALGRPLKSLGAGHPQTEVVHHINGNKTDNSPSNLLVCTHKYLVELHHRLERSPVWPEFRPVIRNQGARHA
jgi:hypothetical protein